MSDLPQTPPASPSDRREKPHHVPDAEVLHGTKQGHITGNNSVPAAPAATASTSPSTLVASAGTTGLRLSESGGWLPPDTQIGVGPNHVFEAVNLEGRIWNRTDGTVTSFSLNTLFGLASTVQLSDPKIRFDTLSNRWFVAIISYNNSFTSGAWRLAVSTSADPTGTFVRYTVSTSKSAPDFPALAVNDDKVVLSANAFRGNSFVGTEFIVLNKANLLAGTSVASAYFGPPQGLFTVQPAHALSSTCVASGNCPMFMAAVAFNSATSIQVWTVRGVPGVSSVTISKVSGAITTLTSPPDAQQPQNAPLIQTNDNRLLDASYRNGYVWLAANSACVPAGEPTTRACMRFIQLSSGSTISKLQDFDVGQLGAYYYYPAIQIDGNGNLVAVFSGSSTSTYASVYASGQKTTDGVNTFQRAVLLHGGENVYTPAANRWGDYSGAAIDPASGSSTVWVAGEYARIEGGSEWGTWIGSVQLP